jgi:hypothetical protein
MANVPGMPGSQVANDGDLMRMIQDLQRDMRELKAQDLLATAGISAQPNGITVGGSETVNGPLTVNGASAINGAQSVNGPLTIAGSAGVSGPLNVTGTATFTGDTTIGGNANVTGNVTKSNSWGTASLGAPAVVGTAGASSPAVTFTRTGTTFGQSVGMGLKDSSGNTSLTINGPHASDPAFLQLLSDQSFVLGSGATSGPEVTGSPGANGNVGLYGGSTNGGVTISPYGTGKCQVYGNFAVTGTKAFIMDHPVHPGTMELMHAATESPVNGVEYWGSVTLDSTGKATATLPTYFEALTKSTGRNIQLTPIGRTTVQVSADRISGGKLTIYGAAGQAVDWLVKAERQWVVDGYDELSFPAEQDKVLIGPQLPGSSR